MYKFSQRSLENLNSAHPFLQRLFTEVIKLTDCAIMCGHRDKREQEEAFKKGYSMAHWLQSPHNYLPSLAVDCVPYPTLWGDKNKLKQLGIIVKSVASNLSIPIKWGGDFKSFEDLPHYELQNWKTILKTDILYFDGKSTT